MQLPTTVDRVPLNTAEESNERIRRETEARIARLESEGQIAIARRLRELDAEWDIERTLESNASTIILLGLGLGAFVDKRFYVLPAAVAGFLLQHALQGWCPPLPVFRRFGLRTQPEIEEERYALKGLRGDFDAISQARHSRTAAAVNAVRR